MTIVMRPTNTKPWNSARAMLYGAAIGLVAAAFKLLAPWSEPHTLGAIARELTGASLAFALLCGLAAALRNFIVRRLVGAETE
ncbi:MAG: hypothetical protein ABSE22_16540 [Xanthobacteraceae bacterium]